jgi:uncharacterized repeat protein (TIGR03943 family)
MKYFISDLKDLTNFLLNHATSITLIVILDALVWMLISENYTAFLHPRFWPFLLAATMIIVLYISAIIIGKRMQSNVSMSQKIVKFFVLLTPLFVLYTVVGQGMGVHAFSKKNIDTEQGALQFLKDLAVQEPDDIKTNTENEYSILDLTLKMRQLNGQRVVTEGLTYTDANVPKGHMMLFRFGMVCCAADATPIGIEVNIGDIEPLKNESWAKVKGILKISKIRGKDTPVIHADTIEKMKTPPPGAQYIFF